jgi:hypothetical protein
VALGSLRFETREDSGSSRCRVLLHPLRLGLPANPAVQCVVKQAPDRAGPYRPGVMCCVLTRASPMNGDPQSEKLCSELGPGCEALDGRNVNIESLYEVRGALRALHPIHSYTSLHISLITPSISITISSPVERPRRVVPSPMIHSRTVLYTRHRGVVVSTRRRIVASGYRSAAGLLLILTLTIPQYGSRAGVWRILRLFKEYGVKCTSYMVGQALLMNPEVGRVMVQEGHEVAR